MNSKILLTNYPRIQQQAQFETVPSKKRLDIVVGYDINVDNKAITRQIANDLIIALLTYDTIYVEGAHISDIIQVWGSEYLKELLRLKLIQVIPDQELNPAIKRESGFWNVGFFAYPQGMVEKDKPLLPFQPHKWSHIENKFSRENYVGKDANALIYLIDENSADVDPKAISEITNRETALDLKNPLLLNQFNLTDFDLSNLSGPDFPKLLRLQELNKTGILASTLGISNIKTDAVISTTLALKTQSEFSQEYCNGVNSLNSILYDKGFPDLGELFVQNVIGLEEILKLRTSFQGKIFRYWVQKSEYEEKLMRQEIMNLTHNVFGNNISNAIRMTACNLLGLAGFLPGVIASGFDSFILGKIANGWHPNFFLDNNVKSTIDKCIAKKEQEQKLEMARKYFKGVGRNDTCPCGSGKKFKYCHGKGL